MDENIWLPNWDNMDRRRVTLFEMDENNNLIYIDKTEVSVEKNNTFRLLEQPILEDKFCWGELFEGQFNTKTELIYIRQIEKSQHTMATWMISNPKLYSDMLGGKPEPEIDLHQDKKMQRLMADGGFWQQDMGGLLTMFYPPGKTEDDY